MSEPTKLYEAKDSRTPLYVQLMNDIVNNIDEGIYKPGKKLPSVRRMSELRRLSITTVMKAYQELEDRGILVSRPQSGYYVSNRSDYIMPQTSISLSHPRHVDVLDMVRLVLLDSNNEDLLPFGSGVPAQSLLPSTQLDRIMIRQLQSRKITQNITGTAEGNWNLRQQIANAMFLFDTPVQAENVIVTAGCNEAIFIALSVICRAGDQVAVESPCYFGVLQILQELGLKAIEIPSNPLDGISIDSLHTALQNNPIKAVYINSNCNNPLGCSIPYEKKKDIAELIKKYNVPLVEDDSTGELYFGKSRPSTIKSHDKEGLVIYCSSFSKVLAPAYRIGWIIPGKFREQVIQFKHALNLGTPSLQQETIAEYLNFGQYDRHMRRARRLYFQKTKQMSDAILSYFPSGTFVSSPQGGFFLWVQLPESLDGIELYKAARKQNISLAPGNMFSFNGNFSNYLRMNTAFYSPEMESSILQLSKIAGFQIKG